MKTCLCSSKSSWDWTTFFLLIFHWDNYHQVRQIMPLSVFLLSLVGKMGEIMCFCSHRAFE